MYTVPGISKRIKNGYKKKILLIILLLILVGYLIGFFHSNSQNQDYYNERITLINECNKKIKLLNEKAKMATSDEERKKVSKELSEQYDECLSKLEALMDK